MKVTVCEHSTIFGWLSKINEFFISDENYFRSFVAIVSIVLSYLLYQRRWKRLSQKMVVKQLSENTLKRKKQEFLARVGGRYGYSRSKKGFIDDWREAEFPSLVAPLQMISSNTASIVSVEEKKSSMNGSIEKEVYLDYAGSAIPTQSQLKSISKQTQILANPHSIGGGLASDRTYTSIQNIREKIGIHFGIYDDIYLGVHGQEEEESDLTNQEYQLVFTSGATASLKLVAERFPWKPLTFTSKQHSEILMSDTSSDTQYNLQSIQFRSMLLYPSNVHTSVIGMRNIPLERGSTFHCVSPDELLNANPKWFRDLLNTTFSYKTTTPKSYDTNNSEEKKDQATEHHNSSNQQWPNAEEIGTAVSCSTIWVHHLIVLPLECNFSGDRFDWSRTIAAARECNVYKHLQYPTGQVRVCHKWNVLLDSSKAAATSPVDVPNTFAPEYAIASFYKMFGYPTGLGLLMMKKQPKRKAKTVLTNSSEERTADRTDISRHYFGGGSVDVVLPRKDFVVLRKTPRNKYADYTGEYVNLGVAVHGTEHFRGIIQLEDGFKEIDAVGGMKAISSHATCLAEELVRRLEKLLHDNGTPVTRIYGQWSNFTSKIGLKNGDIKSPGPIVAFNIQDRDGSIIGYDEVSRLASLNYPPIQLRTGCFCNPGACQEALSLSESHVMEHYKSGHVCGDRRGVINETPTGGIRASFGKDNLWEDMNALVAFIDKVFVSRSEVFSSLPHTSISSVRTSDNSLNDNIAIIESLFVFPIKSCAAMKVTRWPIHQTGRLSFDREFALVDSSGSAMRLHSHPRMSEIRPKIDLEKNCLVVSAPDCDDLVLSLNLPHSDDDGISPEDVQVCGVLCKGTVVGGTSVSAWFSSFLGVRCWLARHHAGKSNSQSSRIERGDDGLAYSNEASLLLLSQNSIATLNDIISSQGGKAVESCQFRPNIVVRSNTQQVGSNPEDLWHEICIRNKNDTLELNAVGKCARCQMVDIDPDSGMKGSTLRALAQYRRERGKILFGTFFSGKSADESSSDVIWIEEGNEVAGCAI